MGYFVINPSETLTITVNKAFVALVIVLDPTSSKTFELKSFTNFLRCEQSLRCFIFSNSITVLFERLGELIIIISMVFQLTIPSHKQLYLLIIALLLTLDKDVFENALLSYVHLLDILQYALLLHSTVCLN